MATFKAVILKGRNHIKKDGTTNIKIRIYHNGSSINIPTDYYINPSFWKNGSVSSLHPNADIFNFRIREVVQNYNMEYLSLGPATSRMMVTDIKDYITNKRKTEQGSIDFIAFAKELIEKQKNRKTKSWYEMSISAFYKFFNRKKIDVRDITSSRLRAYKEYLFQQGLEPGSISNYLRGLRAIFNKCKLCYNNEDYDIIVIPHDPFKNLEIPIYVRKKKSLDINTLKKIRDTEFSTRRANMARDVFMIMFYMMGINAGDLYNIKIDHKGRMSYFRSKTNRDNNIFKYELSIKIEKELMNLIEPYIQNSRFIFSQMYSSSDNFIRAINTGLKTISKELGIIDITSNWARHTWASLARNKAGVSKADIDFCLGHVNNDYKMADIYIDIDYSICDTANRKVLDLLL